MELKDGVITFYAAHRKQWRQWLEKNHQAEKSVWLIIYKKGSGTPSIYYPEAVDEALCFGWIDSKPNKRDENSYYQFFAKRNLKSNWSKINKAKVEKLMSARLMAPAGMEMVEIAKQSGTWNALDEVENISIPEDLQKVFDNDKPAYENWSKFPRSSRRGILEWILNARRAETRSKRIEETVRMAGKNKKVLFFK